MIKCHALLLLLAAVPCLLIFLQCLVLDEKKGKAKEIFLIFLLFE